MTDYKFKHCRFATDEDIANWSNNFTLPARLAKKAADWQKSQSQQQEPDLDHQATNPCEAEYEET